MSRFLRKVARIAALDALSIASATRGQLGGFDNSQSVVQFILLHHVDPHEEEAFERLVEWLVENFNVVSYSAAVDKVSSTDSCPLTASISFDDGFRDNLVAARILERHGVSACFFVCPSIVGETRPEVIEKFSTERLLYRQPREFMNWDEITSLVDAGHEIGNHSMDHLYMMELSDDYFVDQVASAQEILTNRIGEVNHFSWPYGHFRHFKRHWVKQIFEMGHKSCASGVRGAHKVSQANETTQQPLCLRRESLDVSWPLRHCKYFISKSTRHPINVQQAWPSEVATSENRDA